MIKKFPQPVQDFANMFVTMQEKRHDADYDPQARFSKSQVCTDIDAAEQAIERFESVSAKDRRAFAALVLFKDRN